MLMKVDYVAEVEMAAEFFQREAAASLAAFRLFRLCCVLRFFDRYLLPICTLLASLHEEQGMNIWREIFFLKCNVYITLRQCNNCKL